MQRKKLHRHSITSSARASRDLLHFEAENSRAVLARRRASDWLKEQEIIDC
jgi:hypothetical protein